MLKYERKPIMAAMYSNSDLRRCLLWAYSGVVSQDEKGASCLQAKSVVYGNVFTLYTPPFYLLDKSLPAYYVILMGKIFALFNYFM